MTYGSAARLFLLSTLFALVAGACTATNDPPGEPAGGGGGAAGMANQAGAGSGGGGQGGSAGGNTGSATGGSQGGGGAGPVVDAAPEPERDADPVDLPPPDEKNVNACQHLQGGPFVPVTTATSFPLPGAMAPAVMSAAQAYKLTLPRRGEGYVTFTPSVEADYIIYTSTNLPVAVYTLAGFLVEPVSLELKAQECTQIKGRHVFHFSAAPFVVRFGPDPTNAVDVVVVPAAGEVAGAPGNAGGAPDASTSD